MPAPSQRDIGCKVRVQVTPPSLLTAPTSARAPPLLRRLCCRAASSKLGLPGWIAAKGSTSAFAHLMPPAAGAPGAKPVQPATTGEAPLATPATAGPGTDGAVGDGPAATATAGF